MSDPDIDLKVCPVELFDTVVHSLAELLVASVEGGASVNFILPYTTQEAKAWWIKQRPDIERGSSVLLLALAEEGKKVAGCVILGLAEQPNQPHRADVKKMLVHPDYRRRGLGRVLLHLLEHEALKRHRWLLNLDTEAGSAGERLYTAQGYTVVGQIPNFALNYNGSKLSATTVMYKILKQPDDP